MVKNKCPCYGCIYRSDVCHSICEQYTEWKKEQDAKREQDAKERALRWEMNDFKTQVIKRVRNKKR